MFYFINSKYQNATLYQYLFTQLINIEVIGNDAPQRKRIMSNEISYFWFGKFVLSKRKCTVLKIFQKQFSINKPFCPF